MERITTGIVRHYVICNVRFHRFNYGIVHVKQGEPRRQCEHVGLVWKFTSRKLRFNGKTVDKFV